MRAYLEIALVAIRFPSTIEATLLKCTKPVLHNYFVSKLLRFFPLILFSFSFHISKSRKVCLLVWRR